MNATGPREQANNERLRRAVSGLTIDHVRGELGVSERRACRVLRQHRSTQRKLPRGRVDEARLVADMIELARQYRRYGYRRIAVLLRDRRMPATDGW